MTTVGTKPTPERFFDMAFAFERTAAIKTAVDLEVFSVIGEGADTAAAVVTELRRRGHRVDVMEALGGPANAAVIDRATGAVAAAASGISTGAMSF